MTAISLSSIFASFLLFGSIIVLTLFFAGKHVWTSFKAGDLLGLDPNWADILFAQGTAFAIRSFPWIVLIAFVSAIFLFVTNRLLLATIVPWLPLLNVFVPGLLFVIKIIASR